MSSCLNSAAAVTWQDIVSTYGQKFSEAKKTLVTKYLGNCIALSTSDFSVLKYCLVCYLSGTGLVWACAAKRRWRNGWRNACSMKWQGPRPRGRPKRTWREVVKEDCQARKLNKEDAMDRCRWRKMIKDVWWSGWVWLGECFFWYRPTRVVPDQRPLNGCVCACVCSGTGLPSLSLPLNMCSSSLLCVVNISSETVLFYAT